MKEAYVSDSTRPEPVYMHKLNDWDAYFDPHKCKMEGMSKPLAFKFQLDDESVPRFQYKHYPEQVC